MLKAEMRRRMSPPTRGRGLKLFLRAEPADGAGSPPTRGRGLKLHLRSV